LWWGLRVYRRFNSKTREKAGWSMAYFANSFQKAMKRLSRKTRTAIAYAAFSPSVVLTLYDMMEDYIPAHA